MKASQAGEKPLPLKVSAQIDCGTLTGNGLIVFEVRVPDDQITRYSVRIDCSVEEKTPEKLLDAARQAKPFFL